MRTFALRFTPTSNIRWILSATTPSRQSTTATQSQVVEFSPEGIKFGAPLGGLVVFSSRLGIVTAIEFLAPLLLLLAVNVVV